MDIWKRPNAVELNCDMLNPCICADNDASCTNELYYPLRAQHALYFNQLTLYARHSYYSIARLLQIVLRRRAHRTSL